MPSGISRLLDRAQRRWLMARFLVLAIVWLTVAGVLALLARGAERVLPFTLDWVMAGSIAAGSAVLLAGIIAWFTRPSRDRLAMLVDERAGLRETMSTAVVMSARPDPWSKAAVAHAEETSRRVVLRDALPIQTPRWWPAPLVLALMVFGLGFTPRMDLIERLASGDPSAGPEVTDAAIIEARADVERSTEELRRAMEGVASDDLQKALDDLLAPREDLTEPDDIRREALKQMTELEERLESLANDEKARSLDQLTERMRRIDERGMPDLESLLDAMRNGNFEQAQRELQRLAEKANDPNLSQEERDSLAEQLEKLAERMEQAAQQREELEQKLREAGVDPGLANNPEGLREALEKAGMDQEQIEQLMQEAQQNQQMQQMMQQMAGNCKQCAGGMRQGGGQMAEGMQGLSEQLKEMAATQEQREAAMEAMRQLAASRGSLGQCMGGDCQALGLIPPKFTQTGGKNAGSSWMRDDTGSEVDESAYQIADRLRAPSEQHEDGPMLSSELVFGDQIVGESRQAFREAVGRASQAATESVSNTRVPREYHDVIRRYFGELERAASEEQPATPTREPAPAPSPVP